MQKTVPNAFTLLELLVVIAIMAVVGLITFANFRSFGEDQKLKNAALSIQSFLRQAQTNATTNLKCTSTIASLGWTVQVKDGRVMSLNCQTSTGGTWWIKWFLLESLGNNIEVSGVKTKKISGSDIDCSFPVNLTFASLYGTFSSPCDPNSNLQMTIKDTKTGNEKTLVIEKGGNIYVQ